MEWQIFDELRCLFEEKEAEWGPLPQLKIFRSPYTGKIEYSVSGTGFDFGTFSESMQKNSLVEVVNVLLENPLGWKMKLLVNTKEAIKNLGVSEFDIFLYKDKE